MDRSNRFASNGLTCRRLAQRGGLWAIRAAAVILVANHATLITWAKDEPAGPADKTPDVRVTFEGKPVAGAQVVAIDRDNLIRTVTDRDGKAQLRLSADGKISGIVVLDPQGGVGGRWSRARMLALASGEVVPISLDPAKPHTFRVVDA